MPPPNLPIPIAIPANAVNGRTRCGLLATYWEANDAAAATDFTLLGFTADGIVQSWMPEGQWAYDGVPHALDLVLQ